MTTANEELEAIKRYVLDPDDSGIHLREMAERMADQEAHFAPGSAYERKEMRDDYIEHAAETIAAFIHLAWGGAGTAEYAYRTYQMLCALRDRMRGMNPEATWQYAIDALNVDIQARLRRSERLTLDPDSESEMIGHFFDDGEQHNYLHDLAESIKRLHWERRHSPEAEGQCDGSRVHVGPRGDPAVETHLTRAATEALATYVEQGNIVRGMIENITDTGIVLRDRIGIQRELGVINAETWEAAGWKLADFIESRFGTRAGRREARLARGRWKSWIRQRAGATH